MGYILSGSYDLGEPTVNSTVHRFADCGVQGWGFRA